MLAKNTRKDHSITLLSETGRFTKVKTVQWKRNWNFKFALSSILQKPRALVPYRFPVTLILGGVVFVVTVLKW